MVLHLVRHAEAQPGAAGDPALSPHGVEQAEQLARWLGRLAVDVILHGPARRARETATILGSRLALPVEESDLARDRTPYPDDGDQAYSTAARDWLAATPLDERDPGGRDLSEASAMLLATSDGRSVAVVTHAYVVAWSVAHALGAAQDAWLRLPVENASLTTLDHNSRGELIVRRFNTTRI